MNVIDTISRDWTDKERLKVISHLTAHSDTLESDRGRYAINITIRLVATRNATFLESQRDALRQAFDPEPPVPPVQDSVIIAD